METSTLIENDSTSQNSLLNYKSNLVSANTSSFASGNAFLNNNFASGNVSLNDSLTYPTFSLSNLTANDSEFEVSDNNNSLLSEKRLPIYFEML